MKRIKATDMYVKSLNALLSALRLLFMNRRALCSIVFAYAGLLTTLYLFISTREATISQLLLTLFSIAAAPALFFLLQSISVTYTSGNLRKLVVLGKYIDKFDDEIRIGATRRNKQFGFDTPGDRNVFL